MKLLPPPPPLWFPPFQWLKFSQARYKHQNHSPTQPRGVQEIESSLQSLYDQTQVGCCGHSCGFSKGPSWWVSMHTNSSAGGNYRGSVERLSDHHSWLLRRWTPWNFSLSRTFLLPTIKRTVRGFSLRLLCEWWFGILTEAVYLGIQKKATKTNTTVSWLLSHKYGEGIKHCQ